MKVLRKFQGKSKKIPKTASTASSQTTNCIYCFGSFSLNEAEQQLLCNGEPVRLAPKAFDVLRMLIHHRGCLVTKERLLEELWPDAFVEEANLTVNVASLRKALDKGDEWECIETVPKRGYRFVAHVSKVTNESARELEESRLSNHRSNNKRTEGLNSIAVLPFKNEGCGLAGEYLSAGRSSQISAGLLEAEILRIDSSIRLSFFPVT
jgi:DNA-binding winged helix-turn-helix (wHTH) protein